MKRELTTHPKRYCTYRFCKGPQVIPFERRKDALYCCDDHGVWERNERKRDNVTRVDDLKKLNKNHRILKFLYETGSLVVPKIVLDTMGYDFSVIVEPDDFDKKLNSQKFRIYDFELTVDTLNNLYTIKKIE